MKLPSREQCLEMAEELVESRYGHVYKIHAADIEALIHRAYREGAEAMRDEAAYWRDISVEKPTEAQEVLFVLDGKTVHGAWIGGIFWHSNKKHAACTWMPLPKPITHEEAIRNLKVGE